MRLAQIEEFGPNLKDSVEAGLKLTALDFAAAELKREEIFDRFRLLFERCDVLLTPGAPVGPFPVEQNFPETINGRKFDNYIDWIAPAYLITLVSPPAATAPAGLSRAGLPVGMQIVAPRFEEPLIPAGRSPHASGERRRLAAGGRNFAVTRKTRRQGTKISGCAATRPRKRVRFVGARPSSQCNVFGFPTSPCSA